MGVFPARVHCTTLARPSGWQPAGGRADQEPGPRGQKCRVAPADPPGSVSHKYTHLLRNLTH